MINYNGFRVWGATASEQSGFQLAGGGDVNNDGYDDILIGTPAYNSNTGIVYLIFGHSGSYSDIDMASTTTNFGIKIYGIQTEAYTGYSVAFSNINNDNYDDVIIGSPLANYNGAENSGTIYVLYGGNNTFTADIQLTEFVSHQDMGFLIRGIENDYLGIILNKAGDINNDGIQDIIATSYFGSINTERTSTGMHYVIYGRTGISSGINITTSQLISTPSLGYRILSPGSDNRSPWSCTTVGDQNNDGINDVAVLLKQYDPEETQHSSTATVYIIYGTNGNIRTELELSEFNSTDTYGYRIVARNPSSYETIVTTAGDLNNDGSTDIMIGRPYATINGNSNAGLVYLLLNRYNGTGDVTSIAPTINPTRSPTIVPTVAPTVSPTSSFQVLSSKTYKTQNLYAFAAIHPQNGLPITWGAYNLGGNATGEALLPLQRIIASTSSYVAVTTAGGLVAWGTNSSIKGWKNYRFSNINANTIVSTGGAYAGITTTGGVFTIGTAAVGGAVQSSSFASQLANNIRSLAASASAFAAVTTTGAVYTWGSAFAAGGVSTQSMPSLNNVVSITATTTSFAALRQDGSVVTFGDVYSGGDSSAVTSRLSSGVVHIVGSKSAFAAFKADGSLVTWGHPTRGGNSAAVSSLLQSGVVHVSFNDVAFAALKADGTVVTWGEEAGGGDSSAVQSELTGVTHLYATGQAFAALTSSGRVVVWGASTHGGVVPSSLTSSLLSGVTSVSNPRRAFAALKTDGSVVVWGNAYQGGEAYTIAPLLTSNVNLVCGNEAAFTAVRSDGMVVGWGHMTVLGTTGGVVLAQDIAYASVTSCA